MRKEELKTDIELLARYEREYVKYNQISDARWRGQRTLLLKFDQTLGERDLRSAGYDDLQEFAGLLLAGGLHVNTVRKKLNMIRPLYSWMYAAGLITAEQYVAIRNVKDPRGASAQSEPKPYPGAEMRAFWDALDRAWPLLPASGLGSRAITRWRQGKGPWGRVWKHAMRLQIEAMVRLALDCGLRRSEIFRLELADLHYDNEYLVVWRAAKGKKGLRVQQAVPMTTEVRQALYTWVEFRSLMAPDHGRPWLSCYGTAATHPMSWTRFSTILSDTVGEGWAWHRFRHTCATEWLRAGMKLENVSELLGHASIQQTLAYTKIASEDLTRHMQRHEGTFNDAVKRSVAHAA